MRHDLRQKAVQSILRAKKLPSLLVTTPANVLYLTGLDASEALLLVQAKTATLFVDARYIDVARSLAGGALRVSDRSEIENVLSKMKRCGYEEQHVTAARLRRWKASFKSIKFVHTSGLVEGLRMKKDATEIARIKRALAITDDVLRAVPRMLVPGITEKALATRLLVACMERGADGLAFDPIVAFGPGTSEPHHRPGTRKLKKKDIVQIDLGAKAGGYCADRSEVFFVGEPTREQQRVYEAVLAAKESAEKLVRNGASCAAIDREARRVLDDLGLERYFTHALGHGLGLDIHESPSLSSRAKETLRSGEVVTVEPGVYLPGAFGIRLEDTVFVK